MCMLCTYAYAYSKCVSSYATMGANHIHPHISYTYPNIYIYTKSFLFKNMYLYRYDS